MKAGTKLDTGKKRFSLVSLAALNEIMAVLEYGANKYSPGNWKHVPDAKQRYFDALMRHMFAWWAGERVDAESGRHHLGHAGCCLLYLLSFELGETPEPQGGTRAEAPDPLALTLQGSDEVVAHACGGCRYVAPNERLARECCAPRKCESCGAALPRFPAWTLCDPCRNAARERREREQMDAAEQVPASEYEGDHVCVRGDVYIHVDDWLDDDEEPPRAWAVRPMGLPRPDAYDVAESITEEMYEDAIDDLDVDALQRALDAWWEQQHTRGLIADERRVVVKGGDHA